MIPDLLVCGLGPAGRALAHRALAHGLAVTVVDPHPTRRWTPTYAAWADELPSWLAPGVVAASVPRPVAWGTRRFEIDRPYVVFSTAALQDSLDISGAAVIADRVQHITRPRGSYGLESARLAGRAILSADQVVDAGRTHAHTGRIPRRPLRRGPEAVRLSDGTLLHARRVIDARGLTRSPDRAEQTAYGIVLHRDRGERFREALFMDWRPDNGAHPAETPSFLYAVPLDPDTILLEETCLAGRPALITTELRDRLYTRLRSRGIEFDGSEPVERVRFAVEGARPGFRRFGAAGGYLHPATGYSVAAVLAAADTVAAQVRDDTRGPIGTTLSTRAVHTLRTAGLRALLALPPKDIPVFFDAFFELPPAHQRAYLSGRGDLPGTAAAMAALFAALPWRTRRILVTASVNVTQRYRR